MRVLSLCLALAVAGAVSASRAQEDGGPPPDGSGIQKGDVFNNDSIKKMKSKRRGPPPGEGMGEEMGEGMGGGEGGVGGGNRGVRRRGPPPEGGMGGGQGHGGGERRGPPGGPR